MALLLRDRGDPVTRLERLARNRHPAYVRTAARIAGIGVVAAALGLGVGLAMLHDAREATEHPLLTSGDMLFAYCPGPTTRPAPVPLLQVIDGTDGRRSERARRRERRVERLADERLAQECERIRESVFDQP